MKNTKPFWRTFRVHYKNKHLDVDVVIHDNMRSLLKEKKSNTKVMAWVKCFPDGEICATAHFQKKHLDINTISHEAVHVASGIASRFNYKKIGFRFSSGRSKKGEEAFAMFVGNVTQAFLMCVKEYETQNSPFTASLV